MEALAIPALQVLLLSILFLSVLVEIKTGGIGGGVFLGLIAAGVFWGSQYVQGNVDFYPIVLFLGGILCLIVEILTPTVGLLAGVGLAAMLYSIILVLGGDRHAFMLLGASLALAVLFFALMVKKLPSSRFWNKVVLHNRLVSQQGYVSAETKGDLLGKEGTVLTELHPSGSALIDGTPVDVVSEDTFIPKGERIKVVSTNGARIVVRKI